METRSGKLAKNAIVEHDAKLLLKSEGIHVPDGLVVKELPSEMRMKFPVALKVSDPAILHKTDVGGVKLNLSRPELEKEFAAMKKKFPNSSFLIEEMLPAGVEFIVGVVNDPTFGPVIMLGTGGIYTELYKDVTFRKLPISGKDAEEMVDEIKSSRFCSGFRGIKISCTALIELILSVSRIVSSKDHGITSMDLNPVIANENGVVVADAKISLD